MNNTFEKARFNNNLNLPSAQLTLCLHTMMMKGSKRAFDDVALSNGGDDGNDDVTKKVRINDVGNVYGGEVLVCIIHFTCYLLFLIEIQKKVTLLNNFIEYMDDEELFMWIDFYSLTLVCKKISQIAIQYISRNYLFRIEAYVLF